MAVRSTLKDVLLIQVAVQAIHLPGGESDLCISLQLGLCSHHLSLTQSMRKGFLPSGNGNRWTQNTQHWADETENFISYIVVYSQPGEGYRSHAGDVTHRGYTWEQSKAVGAVGGRFYSHKVVRCHLVPTIGLFEIFLMLTENWNPLRLTSSPGPLNKYGFSVGSLIHWSKRRRNMWRNYAVSFTRYQGSPNIGL